MNQDIEKLHIGQKVKLGSCSCIFKIVDFDGGDKITIKGKGRTLTMSLEEFKKYYEAN